MHGKTPLTYSANTKLRTLKVFCIALLNALDMALAAIEMDFYISISGIVTFNSADELREVVKAIPLERLLIETDSPWLAPVPHRGKQKPARLRGRSGRIYC